jgi:hypothetical protein
MATTTAVIHTPLEIAGCKTSQHVTNWLGKEEIEVKFVKRSIHSFWQYKLLNAT